ncbi:glycosyltransferase [Chitinimonas arctica]|uniref:Glycosyltransferase n=1 Tax=Chitinimonas arctica TaxID=2594795 RepID=A0A516SGP1_9NEIS|nr:glycosyltransferase [Chitinimonas arctica]QDQ27270.1 glycosyltransferase [Chitinimonas arctica]
MIQVSVIVPVYNAAPFLPLLFKALQQQSLADIEFVLVDNGSTDQSAALIAAFAAGEPRARAFSNRQVCGAAAARNTGIAAARGEWLGFVDADDWIAPQMYERLQTFAQAGQLDVAYCNAACFKDQPGDDTGTMLRRPKPAGILSGRDWLVACHQGGEQIASAAVSLVRRSVVLEHDLRWPEGCAVDDEIWTAELLLRARRVAFLDAALYGYRSNPGSASRSIEPQRVQWRIQGFRRVAETLWHLAEPESPPVRSALNAIADRNGLAALGALKQLADSPLRRATFAQLREGGFVQQLRRRNGGLKLWRRLLKEQINCLMAGR